jgi:ERCC4-related helicase
MKREDFGDIFAHNQVEASIYNMGSNGLKIARVYDDMQNELARLEKYCENYSRHVFAVLTKARRTAELLKVPALCELVEDSFAEGKTVLVFVNYTETIEALRSRLSKTIGEKLIGQITGDRTFNQRKFDLDELQADNKRVMLNNIAAGSECVDMHDITGKYPRVSYINPSYRAISILQSIGRPDRAGAKSDILTNLVLAGGTIEESVGAKFNTKKSYLDLLNDGDLIPNGISFSTSKIMAGMDV